MKLNWRGSAAEGYTADGIYEAQWYALKRIYTKRWLAIFHDRDSSGDLIRRLGQGTFGQMKKICRQHADRIEHPFWRP